MRHSRSFDGFALGLYYVRCSGYYCAKNKNEACACAVSLTGAIAVVEFLRVAPAAKIGVISCLIEVSTYVMLCCAALAVVIFELFVLDCL